MAERLEIGAGEALERVLLNEHALDLHIVQQAGSRLRLVLINYDAANADNCIRVEHRQEGCETEIYGMVIAGGETNVSNRTFLLHDKGKGRSEQLFKYVLGGKARGYFEGCLKIAPDAQQTSATQTDRNLILSDGAKMRTLPQLEIYADDVKASHGATTGQLDEHALFYMRQRGLSAAQARWLLVNAFIEDIINEVHDTVLQNRLRKEVEIRLQQLTENV